MDKCPLWLSLATRNLLEVRGPVGVNRPPAAVPIADDVPPAPADFVAVEPAS